MAIKSLADLLNMNQEQEPIMSSMDQAQQNRLMSMQEELPPLTPDQLAQLSTPDAAMEIKPASSVTPKKPMQNISAEKPVGFNDPNIEKAMSALSKFESTQKQDQTEPTTPTSSEKPMSKSEALIAEYNRLMNEREGDLAKARKSDRMLKIGGALGDALATIINAQGQMNVKAPGVQVQQGAGLGKIADMFATAPEISSDIAQRREALMKQYAELAKGERAEKRLSSEEKRADIADKRARELADKELKALETKSGLASEKEERLTRTAQLNAARGLLKDDPRAKKAVEQGMALESIEPLLKEIESGNEMAVQSLGTQLARAMGEVGVLTDTDVIRYVQGTSWGRKLKDWWARGAEGELPKDAIDGIRKNIKAINTNLRTNLTSVYSNAAGRMKTAYPELDDATINGLLGTPALKIEPTKVLDQDDESKVQLFMKNNPKVKDKNKAIELLREKRMIK